MPVGWLWAVPFGAVKQPWPHGQPRPALSWVFCACCRSQQLCRLSKLFVQLVCSTEPGCTAWAAWLKSRSEEIIHPLRCGVEMWTVEFRVNVYPLSRGLALHCPVHCTFLMNLFVFLCQLSYLNAKGFALKITTVWGPRGDSWAVWTTVSWVCWLCFLICISCSISLFCTEDFAAFYHLLFERRLWILV